MKQNKLTKFINRLNNRINTKEYFDFTNTVWGHKINVICVKCGATINTTPSNISKGSFFCYCSKEDKRARRLLMQKRNINSIKEYENPDIVIPSERMKADKPYYKMAIGGTEALSNIADFASYLSDRKPDDERRLYNNLVSLLRRINSMEKK